jgi:hypothetical protein
MIFKKVVQQGFGQNLQNTSVFLSYFGLKPRKFA